MGLDKQELLDIVCAAPVGIGHYGECFMGNYAMPHQQEQWAASVLQASQAVCDQLPD